MTARTFARLSRAEHAALRAAAERSGVSASELVRAGVGDYLVGRLPIVPGGDSERDAGLNIKWPDPAELDALRERAAADGTSVAAILRAVVRAVGDAEEA